MTPLVCTCADQISLLIEMYYVFFVQTTVKSDTFSAIAAGPSAPEPTTTAASTTRTVTQRQPETLSQTTVTINSASALWQPETHGECRRGGGSSFGTGP